MTDNESSEEKKIALDKSELSADRAKEKVELDLDDAPFLEEADESEEPEEQKEAEKAHRPAPVLEEAPEKKLWHDKKILAAIIAVPLAIILAIILYLVLKDKPSEPVIPPDHVTEEEPVFEEIVEFDAFLVELDDGEYIQFLYADFSFPAQSEDLAREIRDKTVILRDGIYYYLRNQEPILLRDKEMSDRVKDDILSVVNQYLSSGNIKDIYIEDYLVK